MGIFGTCDERLAAVRTAFEANFQPKEGINDEGASVAITLDGELVVDLWGGTATGLDGGTREWQADSLINVWSVTKTVSALACLMLAERGQLDLYSPIADVWPEFAVEGKEEVAVRHVLGHTAGLPSWDPPIAVETLYDRRRAAALLAAQAPWWAPGTASGYHGLTQGFLEGEIVQRLTGDSLGRFVAAEICAPLGADFHIGTPPECDRRVVRVVPPSSSLGALIPPGGIAERAFAGVDVDAARSWDSDWRRAEIPSAGGHGNARSVAQIHAPMACGGEANGVRFLSPATIESVFDEQCHGVDLVLGIPLRHGIGFGLPLPELPIGPNARTCFWAGWGGSLAVIDLDARMSFAYVMNRMGEGTVGDLRGASLLWAAYRALR